MYFSVNKEILLGYETFIDYFSKAVINILAAPEMSVNNLLFLVNRKQWNLVEDAKGFRGCEV